MINYLKGDATDPIGAGTGNRIITHICNDVGGWGAGFVLALSRRWPEPEEQYREWAKQKYHTTYGGFALGNVGWAKVSPGLWVANMIAQTGYGKGGRRLHKGGTDSEPPIRYHFLRECLEKVAETAIEFDEASIHMPRIGCGLAGGSWDKVEPIIKDVLSTFQVNVYDL